MQLRNPFIFLLLFPVSVFAQDPFLDRLNVSVNDGRVALSWTISAGNTCDGTVILRSIDSLNYIPIGEIEGICGSVLDAVTYRYVDQSPFKNTTNYYRLEFGNVGISDPLSVFVVDYGSQGYWIHPNPMSEQGRIYFKNTAGTPTSFSVYSMKGEKVLETTTKLSVIDFSLPAVLSGVFLFTLQREGTSDIIQGKIVVQ